MLYSVHTQSQFAQHFQVLTKNCGVLMAQGTRAYTRMGKKNVTLYYLAVTNTQKLLP